MPPVSFLILVLWIASLLAATWLGFDRGRWLAGLLLGLSCGPIGVIAAGLMLPSLEVSGARKYEIQRRADGLRAQWQRELDRRRNARVEFEAWIDDVEHQLDAEEAGFAERLLELATQIETTPRPGEGDKMKAWAHWLREKADMVKTAPRYQEIQ